MVGAVRPLPFHPCHRLFLCSRHANQGGREMEKTMTTIDFTLVTNALAQLLTASAKFIKALRQR